MDKSFWNDKWRLDDIPFNQAQPNEQLKRFFPELGLSRSSKIFVPLCGKSIDMIWLLQQGHSVVGLELNETACRQFFEEHDISFEETRESHFTQFKGENITLLSGDFFTCTPQRLGPIDAVYDRAALVALPIEMRQQYAKKLIEVACGAKILLITASYNQNEMAGPPFSVTEPEVHALFEKRYSILKVFDQAESLPPHLIKRGLTAASEQIYILST